MTSKLEYLFSSYGDVKDLRQRRARSLLPDHRRHHPQQHFRQAPRRTYFRNRHLQRRGRTAGQPGIQSNIGASVADAGGSGRGASSSSTTNQTENTVIYGETHTQRVVPAGVEIKDLTASISLPRSYFVLVYRKQA